MTAYLSSLASDLDSGVLLVVYVIGISALTGCASALVVYGIPALKAWIAPRWSRWHSRQARRASLPQDFPPKDDAISWIGPLLVILPLVALVVAIMRCQGVGG